MATAGGVSELETAEAHPTTAPQPSPAAVLRVAPVEADPHGQSDGGAKHVQPLSAPLAAPHAHAPAMRIHARVPPPEPPRANTVAPLQVATPLESGAGVAVYAQTAVVRENQFRVRTALTKGWRKGKKSRKSVGGGRGPGFTAREVDGLLELLEEAVPVTREEWEAVRNKHALRFPGTSRSIDSIRRKFAKVYLARGQPGAVDGNPPMVVRRAKVVRERMAQRAVNLDEEEAAMEEEGDVPTVEAMEGSELPDDEELDEHGEVGAQTVNLDQPVLDEGNIAVLQPVVSEPMSIGGGVAVTVPVHGHGHGHAGVNVQPEPAPMDMGAQHSHAHQPPLRHAAVGMEKGGEELAAMLKGYMEQQMRLQEAWREEWRAMEKARDERNEKFMESLVVLLESKRDS